MRGKLAVERSQRYCETHVTDVTDDASVEQLFDAVVERYGHLDLLFNNAGIVPPGLLRGR